MFYTIINYSRAVSPRWRLAATQMIDPDNTLLKYCIVNNTDTHAVGWRAARFGSRVARFTAGQSLPPGFRAARECFGVVQRNCYQPGFRAARQCFGCKEVVIAHIRVARPLSMKLCTKKIIIQRRTRTNRIPFNRMITGPIECRTYIFRQICARTSKLFFNKQTRYSN